MGEIVDRIVTASTLSRLERWRLAKTARIARQITIAAINRIAVFEAPGAGDSPVVLSCESITQYSSEHHNRKCAGNYSLQAQRSDRFHDAIAQRGIQILPWRLEIGCTENDRFTNYNGNGHKPKTASFAR